MVESQRELTFSAPDFILERPQQKAVVHDGQNTRQQQRAELPCCNFELNHTVSRQNIWGQLALIPKGDF